MKELKKYQQNAIHQLMQFTNIYLDTPQSKTIVFQSPTGSGKTLMIARYILNLTEEVSDDLCFVWISIGKGDLQVQSYKSVKKEIGDGIECSLLESDFFGSRDIINQNEIVFVNWEKIRSKDKKTNEFKNVLMKDSEQNNFPDVLKNTKEYGRKIILIIDESHYSSTTDRAIEIRDKIINPELTIEMSATPVFTANNLNTRVVVDPTDVINEGMIKKEIIINDKIEELIKQEDSETTSELLILESAYAKEEELKKRYENAYKNEETTFKIKPLTIIQIPNSAFGEAKRIEVEKFLGSKGVTTENGKLAVWLSDEKINESYEELNPLDSNVEYLIFKMAIDTGWDCPRAQVLLKFREVSSITFEIQTVGRILRMPEAKHYKDEELNKAFVYSNIQSIAIKKEIYNPNIIKSYTAEIKPEYKPALKEEVIKEEKTDNDNQISFDTIDFTQNIVENVKKDLENNIIYNSDDNKEENNNYFAERKEKYNVIKEFEEKADKTLNIERAPIEEKPKTIITLKSYYKKRTDYGDITSSFYKVYEREFCNYFGIRELVKENDIPDITLNHDSMEEKGINFDLRKKDEIMSDVHVESEKVDKGIDIDDKSALVDIVISDADLQNDFEAVIRNNLNGFAPVRSIPTIKTAIINTFIKYLNYTAKHNGIIYMQNIVVNNATIFSEIITKATENYKPIHKYEVDKKEGYEIIEDWHIPEKKNYNPNTSLKVDSKLSIYQPLYVELKNGKADQLELDFIKYLDDFEDKIEYFWKNGSEHMNTNFGIEKEDGTAFQPDFLILFKNGKVGIFDTKAGKGYNENDNEEKSNALQQYIVDENSKGKNLVGGLVIKNNGNFYYYDRGVYKTYEEEPSKWKNFSELLK